MERLKQRADFLAAATGTRAPAAAFVLQARKRADEGPARVGLTVSKKVGNAVERNRVRRRLRDRVDRIFCHNMTMPEDTDPISTSGELPEGTTALDVGPLEIVHDMDLALDLARLGASPTLLRALGGEEAVREAAAANGNGNAAHR